MTIHSRNDLSAMTVDNLRKIAKERELKGYSRLKKDDLVDFIYSSYTKSEIVKDYAEENNIHVETIELQVPDDLDELPRYMNRAARRKQASIARRKARHQPNPITSPM